MLINMLDGKAAARGDRGRAAGTYIVPEIEADATTTLVDMENEGYKLSPPHGRPW